MKKIKNIKVWQVFELLGVEDTKKQKELLPFIKKCLKDGFYVTSIVSMIGHAESGVPLERKYGAGHPYN